MNQRTASAPYLSTIGSGSMVLRFDLDIFSTRPRSTGAPVARSTSPPPPPPSRSSWSSPRPPAPPRRAGRALDQPPALAVFDLVGVKPAAVQRPIGLVRDHALREQALERLRAAQVPHVLERTGPEAGVEQMQDRMLDTADILRDRQPFFCLRAVERLVRAPALRDW